MTYVNLPTVCIVVLPYRGNLLCVRRALPDGHGKVALVGGFQNGADKEHIRIAAAREVKEELGIEINPAGLRIVEATTDQHGQNLLFFLYNRTELNEIDYITDYCKIDKSEVLEAVILTPVYSEKIAFPLHKQVIDRYFQGLYD